MQLSSREFPPPQVADEKAIRARRGHIESNADLMVGAGPTARPAANAAPFVEKFGVPVLPPRWSSVLMKPSSLARKPHYRMATSSRAIDSDCIINVGHDSSISAILHSSRQAHCILSHLSAERYVYFPQIEVVVDIAYDWASPRSRTQATGIFLYDKCANSQPALARVRLRALSDYPYAWSPMWQGNADDASFAWTMHVQTWFARYYRCTQRHVRSTTRWHDGCRHASAIAAKIVPGQVARWSAMASS